MVSTGLRSIDGLIPPVGHGTRVSNRSDADERRRGRSRRAVLASVAAGLFGLAGCSSTRDGTETEPSPTATPTSTTGTADDAASSTTASSTPTSTSTRDATPTRTATRTREPAERTEITDHEGPYTAAFYYPWWGPDRHWDDGYVHEPTLGEYSCRDGETIRQHVDWASAGGIDSFYHSWWGPDSWIDRTLSEHVLPATDFRTMDFAILYETTGRLDASGDTIDLSAADREQLVADFEYLAEQYFTSPGYATIDGAVPVFFYLTRILEGDIVATFDAVRDAVDHDLFLIGDQVYWQDPGGNQTARVMEAMDAVTAYNMHRSVPDIDDGFVADTLDQYETWKAAADDHDVAFIPDVIPGFDDTAVRPEEDHPVIERDPEQFRGFVDGVQPLLDDSLETLFVTSFNEWHEDTQVEPGTAYGTAYLDALSTALDTLP